MKGEEIKFYVAFSLGQTSFLGQEKTKKPIRSNQKGQPISGPHLLGL